jgi:hypothetical protein
MISFWYRFFAVVAGVGLFVAFSTHLFHGLDVSTTEQLTFGIGVFIAGLVGLLSVSKKA